MFRNRVVYAVWLLAVGCLYLFGNDFGTRVIFIASLFIPAVLILLCLIVSRKTELKIEAPYEAKRDETVNILFLLKGIWFFPVQIKCSLVQKNLFTGEEWVEDLVFFTGKNSFPVKLASSGMYAFSVRKLKIVDLFGLSSWGVISPGEKKVMVWPNTYELQLDLPPGGSVTWESDEYSMDKPGNDISEIFGVREYAAGDSLKSIHWKLSNKTDRLLVREFGLPIEKNVLVFVNTHVPDTGLKDLGSYGNKLADEAYSTCLKLLLDDMVFSLAWHGEYFEKHKVTSKKELDEAFIMLLSDEISNNKKNETASPEFDLHQLVLVGGA